MNQTTFTMAHVDPKHTFTVTLTNNGKPDQMTFEVTTPYTATEDDARYLKRTMRMIFDGETATSGIIRTSAEDLIENLVNTVVNMRNELAQVPELLRYRDEVRASYTR